ncbi:MAG TPA: ABC transporter substrate-binding protein [Gaiellaceae bacterium]|nr:ABC transporter substrate-binding protein [Gaiellaceae bacterium]
MRKAVLLLVLGAGLLLAAGCGGDDDDGDVAGGTTTTAEASCDKESLELVNAGQLTIGTDNPAFPPWFEGTKEFDPWDPTTTPTKNGYEQETAYAIAEQLGFTDDEVKWTVIPFNQSFRPGPKSFDFDINQISYKPQRAEAVDFSDSYYDVEQAIVTVEGSKIDAAASIADLEDAKLGAQIGTTSLEAINDTIQPSSEPSVYDTNNDAISGLKAKQVDGIVVDFPTALFMAAVQLDNGKVVGRLPAAEGGEYFGVVLEKDSSLTECVNEAIQAIKDDGTLDELEQKWLTGSAPVLE